MAGGTGSLPGLEHDRKGPVSGAFIHGVGTVIMEVFSRPFPSSSAAIRHGEGDVLPPVMGPEQLLRLFDRHLAAICSRFEDVSHPVTVRGSIGEVPSDRWRRREGTPLLDQQTGDTILLDVPPPLLEGEGLHPGDVVRVWGMLRARLQQGQVVPCFEVFSIQRDGEQALIGQYKELRQTLCHGTVRRRDFPARVGARMLLLGSGVDRGRLAALRQRLGGFWREADITLRCIGGETLDSLPLALARVEQEIIFLVLGEQVLPLLDTNALLQALQRCPAYRVLVCETGENGQDIAEDMFALVLPYVVECFSDSQAEAASHIREKTVEMRQKQDEERAQQEELTALRTSLATLSSRPVGETGRRGRSPALAAGVILGIGLCLAGWWMLHML